MPPSADLRGFVYPLEAVMRQRQWQLDRLRTEWAKCQRATREARQRWVQLHGHYETMHKATAAAWSNRLDAALHRASLGYLARLQTTMDDLRKELETLAQRQAEARDRYLRQRQRLDAIEQDRGEAATTYAQDRARQQAVEADRDWLSRIASASAIHGVLGHGDLR